MLSHLKIYNVSPCAASVERAADQAGPARQVLHSRHAGLLPHGLAGHQVKRTMIMMTMMMMMIMMLQALPPPAAPLLPAAGAGAARGAGEGRQVTRPRALDSSRAGNTLHLLTPSYSWLSFLV